MKLIYTTFSDKTEAEHICKKMINEKLAACVHLLPKGESFYAWQGEFVVDVEYIALFKTSDDKAQLLMSSIEKEHSYEVPCVLELKVNSVLESYNNWLNDALK